MRTRRQDRLEAEAASKESTPVPTSAPASARASRVVSSTKLGSPRRKSTSATAKRQRASRLPKVVQLPLLVILYLALSSLGYWLTYKWTKAKLATNARLLQTWPELGAVMGWRIFELALGWFGNYDGYDLAALIILSHGPSLYLLSAFYKTPNDALLYSLAIETLATYIPFRLLRSLSIARADPASTPNAELLTDKPIALLTSLLSGIIYTITLFAAYMTYLPNYLITYFNSLPSLDPAHKATYIQLLPVTLALGFAATSFIFTPSEGEDPREPYEFDPVRATFGQTVWWNIWGYSARAKLVIRRTIALMLVTGISTTLQTMLTLKGVELAGAAAWASVWVAAAGITGFALGTVGSV